ncbi:hypothetical protein [Comamonas sp. MYb396]|uniref:hypothetical protein n=1 Tax=Comamonas sp. MYb396 TaxID=2745302 RepID=UPI0030AC24BB
MKFGNETRALWLRTRYREQQYEGEACLLVYDDESFSDLMVSGDIKEVFERRANTANIFIAAPFLSGDKCRTALKPGTSVQRAASYLSGRSGNVYLVELCGETDSENLVVMTRQVSWDSKANEAIFGKTEVLSAVLQEGWLFDLFDRNEGLIVAPAGVHFRKSSRKHTGTFLRAANALTCSAACGLLALLSLQQLGRVLAKRIFVDTAPLLSLAFALTRVARVHNIWTDDVPARSFSSYGGLKRIGRLSTNDIVLVSASTSGSLAREVVDQGGRSGGIVTLYFLSSDNAERPKGVLCDLTITAEKNVGYQPIANFPADNCRLCKSYYLLAELEGDQFLLQQRRHRLLKIIKSTQSQEARAALTDLHKSQAIEVLLRAETGQTVPITVNETLLLSSTSVRPALIRLLQRYTPQPLALIVRVNISEGDVIALFADATMSTFIPNAKIIDWTEVTGYPTLAKGAGVLVIFGCLTSQTRARSINASLRSVVDEGNVAYLSALTLASSPEQYRDLKTFLGYGERGPETFTYREVKRLALPEMGGSENPWEVELQLLDTIAEHTNSPELNKRRNYLSDNSSASEDIFLPGKDFPLAIRRDFVYLDTSDGTANVAQATVFTVISNLLCVARSNNRELGAKPGSSEEVLTLAQSVYGHVLVDPITFLNYNDPILKASILRAAKPSELMYEADEIFSSQVSEIVLSELGSWHTGSGDALPEMLLAMATSRLRLREIDRLHVRNMALQSQLPPLLEALAKSIPS